MFHLQTRRPALLPPLCELFGLRPDSPRLFQQPAGAAALSARQARHAQQAQQAPPPSWPQLADAASHLSSLSVAAASGGASANSNSETLLELLASFFALYDGLVGGGWAVSKGADAPALRE